MNTQLSIVTTCHPNPEVMSAFNTAVKCFADDRKLPVELIIVIDSLSSDTASCSFEFGKYVATRLLVSDGERGQTGSMIQGLVQARSDRVLSIDPDMASSFYAIDEMLALLKNGYHVVVARRELRYRAGWRAASTYLFNALVSLVLGFRVHDLNSPMFLVGSSVIRQLSSLSLPLEAYKLRLFMDYRSGLIETPVRDISSRVGIASTYRIGMLCSLFIKRLWVALKLRIDAN